MQTANNRGFTPEIAARCVDKIVEVEVNAVNAINTLLKIILLVIHEDGYQVR